MTYRVAYVSDRRRMTAILLCCMGFIALAGIHRIYAGRVLTGILYFLTAGIFGFGTFFDLVLLILGRFRDNEGAPIIR